MKYLRAQIAAVSDDQTLRWYGAALALTNVVTAVFWLTTQPLERILAARAPVVCWPFLEDCYRWRVLSGDSVSLAVMGFLVAALINAWLFGSQKQAPSGWVLLLLLTLVKAGVLAQDFRLTLNQHYMSLWVTLVFLLVPAKRWVVPRLIVCFYLAAGLLKLNPEWISGAGLYGRRPFSMPAQLIPWACMYVILLELVIVFGLFSRRRWLFWASLAQLVIFHLSSFWVVGFFYPILMFLILSIFPLLRLGKVTPEELETSALDVRAPLTGAIVLAVFVAMQLVPRMLPGDRALTGEGRIFALNMFDAPVECKGSAVVHETQGDSTIRLGAPLTQARIVCDPILYFEIAKSLCRMRSTSSRFKNLDLLLESRRSGQSEYQRVVDLTSVCSSDTVYSFWHHNAWIRTSEQH